MNPFVTRDRRHYRRWMNILPALFIPGSAHFVSGRKKVGLAWFAAALVLGGVAMALVLSPQSSYTIPGGFHWLDLVCCAVGIGQIVDACRRPIRRIGLKGWAAFLAVFVVIFLVPALAVRHFAVEAFRIPTSAMEPTLIGKEVGGDRILVDKLRYRRQPPQRWDIVVFKIDKMRINYHRAALMRRPTPPDIAPLPNGTITYPGRAKTKYVNYVKRLVGLPGDSIQFKNGDVFIKGKICHKPEDVEEALLVPVAGVDPGPPSDESFFEDWRPTGGGGVRFENGVLHLPGSRAATGAGVRYSHPIEDRVETDERTTRRREERGNLNIVGDLKLRLRLRHVGGAGRLVGRLEENGSVYEFALPLGGLEGGARLHWNGKEVAQAAPFPAIGEHELTFSNIDARVTLRIDGKALIRYANDAPSEAQLNRVVDVPGYAGRSGVEFAAHKCDVDVRAVSLWRDVYYTSDPALHKFAVRAPFTLAPDEYFAMGDNSPNSFDSRNWGVVKKASIVGKVFYVFAPADRKKWIE